MHGERRFEFVISQLGIALLLVLGEDLVRAERLRRGGDQHRVAVDTARLVRPLADRR